MYLRTEDNQFFEIHKDNDPPYIMPDWMTRWDAILLYLFTIFDDPPYVLPASATQWELLIDMPASARRLEMILFDDQAYEDTITVATFETVKEAVSARSSLRKAIRSKRAWDAVAFKRSKSEAPQVRD